MSISDIDGPTGPLAAVPESQIERDELGQLKRLFKVWQLVSPVVVLRALPADAVKKVPVRSDLHSQFPLGLASHPGRMQISSFNQVFAAAQLQIKKIKIFIGNRKHPYGFARRFLPRPCPLIPPQR